MSADQVHNSDKPVEKHDAAPKQPQFDALALMKEHNTGGKDGSQDTKTSKAEADHLIMTDPFAGLQGTGDTRGVKAKGHDAPKAHDAHDAPKAHDSSKDKGASQNDPTDGQPIKIVGKPEHPDPNKPNVAVLDDFAGPKEKAGGLSTETHGDISAKAAEANGFNVYRVQTSDASYGEQMKALDDKIKSGELPLGKGDAVNVSLGMPSDLSIKDTTGFFGAQASNDNLAQNKDKLLDGFKAKSEDASNPGLQAVTRDVVQSNDAIKDMQDKGIKVLHAAGNEGTDKYSAHFLNATELNSTRPNGQVDSFSADHNLTVRGDGVLPVTTRPADPFSKTPLAQDKGSSEIQLPNGKTLSQPITELNKAWTGDRVPFDRNSFDAHTYTDQLKEIPNEQPNLMISADRLGNKETRFTPGRSPKPDFDAGQLRPAAGDSGLSITQTVPTRNDNNNLKFTDTPSADKTPKVAGVLAGTSFSNIGYLADHKEEMERLKREGK
ncbi:MAG: hypothetical protein KGS72_04975 [Cyanobacteria bacterium REEB67]|nr:hypothetical protein [Cyanobacteria bacterium REEB67]